MQKGSSPGGVRTLPEKVRLVAAEVRDKLASIDRSKVEPQRSVWSRTGYTNVIKVGKRYQARYQLPGDGRGGTKKRKQVPLPGLYLACLMRQRMRRIISPISSGLWSRKDFRPRRSSKASSRTRNTSLVARSKQLRRRRHHSSRLQQPLWVCRSRCQ